MDEGDKKPMKETWSIENMDDDRLVDNKCSCDDESRQDCTDMGDGSSSESESSCEDEESKVESSENSISYNEENESGRGENNGEVVTASRLLAPDNNASAIANGDKYGDATDSDNSDDDITDDSSAADADDEMTVQSRAEFDLLERDWQLRLQVIEKEGFRAGVEAGQDKKLQEGFNKGYKTAAERTYKLSKCRGLIAALFALHNSGKGMKLTEEAVLHLQTLVKEIDSLDARIKESALAEVEVPDPGCDKDTCCGGTCKGDQDSDSKEASQLDLPQSVGAKDTQNDVCAGTSAQCSSQETFDKQEMRDGRIAYEQGDDRKKKDYSLLPKEIDSLHGKVTTFLENYGMSNVPRTEA